MNNHSNVLKLTSIRADRERKKYAKMVLSEFNRQNHEKQRNLRDHRAEVERRAKEKL